MPYHLVGNCVTNSDTGKTVPGGCHENHADAVNHMRALYANVPDARKEVDEMKAGPGRFFTVQELRDVARAEMVETTGRRYITEDELLAWSKQKLADVKKWQDAMFKEAGDMPSPYNAHGPGGILSMPGQGGTTSKKKKKKGVTNSMTTPLQQKELGGFLVTEADGTTHLPTRVNGKLDSRHLAAARAALTSNYRGHSYSGPNKSAALAKLKKLYAEAGLKWDDEGSKEAKADEFLVTKDAKTGKPRWMLYTSSAFRDRDGEIVSRKAHEQDVAAMELTGQYGELLWWHCDGELHEKETNPRPYIPLGQCDFSAMHGRISIESGTFYDDAVGEILSAKQKELSASRSFYHPKDEPDADGIFMTIRTKERSLLPRGEESNLLTRLKVWFGGKEKDMDKNRVAKLEELLGKDLTDSLLREAETMEKTADEAGLSSKEMKGKKKPADDEEDAADQGDDEAAEGEKPTKKEAAFDAVAFKEAMTPFADAMTAFKELTTKQNERLDTMDAGMKLLSRQVKALLGDQPKSASKGYRASEAEDSVIDDSQKASVKDAVIKKYKEMAGEPLNEVETIADWLMTGVFPTQQ